MISCEVVFFFLCQAAVCVISTQQLYRLSGTIWRFEAEVRNVRDIERMYVEKRIFSCDIIIIAVPVVTGWGVCYVYRSHLGCYSGGCHGYIIMGGRYGSVTLGNCHGNILAGIHGNITMEVFFMITLYLEAGINPLTTTVKLEFRKWRSADTQRLHGKAKDT